MIRVIFLLLVLCTVSCTPVKQVKIKKKGYVTPLYSMSLPQINTVDFPFSALRGKVVLIDFFASYCMPCLHIIPKLKTLYATNRRRGFLVLGVAMDRQVKQILKPFVNYLQIDYPVLVANVTIHTGSTVLGKVLRIPRSILIDRCGKIRRVYVGVHDPKKMQAHVEQLLDDNSCRGR